MADYVGLQTGDYRIGNVTGFGLGTQSPFSYIDDTNLRLLN